MVLWDLILHGNIHVLYDNEGCFICAVGVWCVYTVKVILCLTPVITTCTEKSQILIINPYAAGS